MTKWKEYTEERFPSFDFEKEKSLEGCLTEIRENVGPNRSYLFIIEQKGGEKVSVWGSTILNRLAKLKVGTVLKIDYLGKVKGKGPKPYANYSISIDEESLPIEDIADQVFSDSTG
jgi:hypothetical protein